MAKSDYDLEKSMSDCPYRMQAIQQQEKAVPNPVVSLSDQKNQAVRALCVGA